MTARSRVARLLGALLLLPGACALNPMRPMSPAEEVEEGKKAVAAIRAEVGLVSDEALTEYVRSIGQRLAEHSPRRDTPYEFYVVDREEVNAFAVPGGHIFVTRGLLALADSEDELANVMGHEVGHVAARHYAASSWRKAGGSLVAVLGGIAGSFLGLSELGSRPGRGLIEGYNRNQEREADEIGQRIATEAGFDPQAMPIFLKKLERDVIIALGAKPDESILDSHPATGERIATSQERAAMLAGSAPRDAPKGDYLERIQGLTLGQDPRAGVFKDELFLHPDLNVRIRFPEDWTMVNRPAFVAAVDPPVQIRVEFAGRGTDLDVKARAWLRIQEKAADAKQRKPEPAPPAPSSSSDGSNKDDAQTSAAAAEPAPDFQDFELKKAGKRLLSGRRVGYAFDGEFFRGRGTARVYFLNVGDSVYRVTCAMPTPLALRYMEDCDRTAASMRPLAAKDRQSVEWTTLAIESAKAGEDLRAFNVRTQNHWNESQTAAANGLQAPYQLHEGQRLKISRARPYESKAAAGASEPEPEGEAEDAEDGADD